MIHKCTESDFDQIFAVINDAAMAYKGVIPDTLWKEPFVSRDYLRSEIENGVQFVAYTDQGNLHGVMGTQEFDQVTLIRHSYVLTSQRRKGIGSKLLEYQTQKSSKPVLVGCLKAMDWAIAFYQKHGFRLLSDDLCDELRAKYWALSTEHVRNSVVLADNNWFEAHAQV